MVNPLLGGAFLLDLHVLWLSLVRCTVYRPVIVTCSTRETKQKLHTHFAFVFISIKVQ